MSADKDSSVKSASAAPLAALASFLADKNAKGVRCISADPSDIQRTVEAAGWRFARVKRGGSTRESFTRAIGVTLKFPAYYGQNWSAMFDCLCDIDEPTVLLWDDWMLLEKGDDSTALETAFRVFNDRGAGFIVLLQGEGASKFNIPAMQ